ncbi:hypothetical protein C8J57DRAFT_1489764 [Mycena rebaudengoi]|nr:hypothetical protein C8J57DRAFT_1489764 [Mycena rebaudengoi]
MPNLKSSGLVVDLSRESGMNGPDIIDDAHTRCILALRHASTQRHIALGHRLPKERELGTGLSTREGEWPASSSLRTNMDLEERVDTRPVHTPKLRRPVQLPAGHALRRKLHHATAASHGTGPAASAQPCRRWVAPRRGESVRPAASRGNAVFPMGAIPGHVLLPRRIEPDISSPILCTLTTPAFRFDADLTVPVLRREERSCTVRSAIAYEQVLYPQCLAEPVLPSQLTRRIGLFWIAPSFSRAALIPTSPSSPHRPPLHHDDEDPTFGAGAGRRSDPQHFGARNLHARLICDAAHRNIHCALSNAASAEDVDRASFLRPYSLRASPALPTADSLALPRARCVGAQQDKRGMCAVGKDDVPRETREGEVKAKVTN